MSFVVEVRRGDELVQETATSVTQRVTAVATIGTMFLRDHGFTVDEAIRRSPWPRQPQGSKMPTSTPLTNIKEIDRVLVRISVRPE